MERKTSAEIFTPCPENVAPGQPGSRAAGAYGSPAMMTIRL